MPAQWFTPIQYMQARQYYWQKLEEKNNIINKDIQEEQINYFNTSKKQEKKSQYDILFHFEPGWDQEMWRSDRSNPRHIHEAVFREEEKRTVPVLTSSNYGHRKTPLEGKPVFMFKRTNPIQEFYRVNGVNMDPTRGLPRDPNIIL